jgi:glutamine synthetase
MTLDEVLKQCEHASVRRVKLGVFDLDTTLRGKYISLDKFSSVASNGAGFCDVLFGWDIADTLYEGIDVQVTGWHTGYPDAAARIDLDSFRLIPWEPGTAFFLLDLYDKQGEPLPMAPRNVLKRVLNRAASKNYEPFFAAEYEFFLFRETPQSIREKDYCHLTPLSPGMFGYSVLRASQHADLVLALFDQLNAFQLGLEGLHTETGPGVYEAAIHVDRALPAADKAALFKTAVKEICARHQVLPTFMAKWAPDLPGAGGHIHQSLWDKSANTNLFFPSGLDPMSDLMRFYIGGLVKHLPALTSLLCPTINSYKRTVPGAWAPVNATWGIDNRTTAIRAIPGPAKSTRVEMRASGADLNPYLAMAACVAAGIDGIENQIEPPPAATNAYAADTSAPALPRSLREAAALLSRSELAHDWFSSAFVNHYTATREWECRQFDKAVTNWELARYFESV